MWFKYLTENPNKTKKLGEALAKEIIQGKNRGKAQVLSLEGDLGGGKTTFLQGFAKGLGIKQRITSPTFIIMRKYETSHSYFKLLYHFDCYRIKKPKEITYLGFKEIISNPQNIVVIEWGERIRKILPKNTLILKFEFVNKTTRRIMIE